MHNFLKLKSLIYLQRILVFILFFHGIMRPIQSNLNEYVIAPIIEKKLKNSNSDYNVRVFKNHTIVYNHVNQKHNNVLVFSFPFGQFYFFLIFFFWFKPWTLIKAISIYNIILIPIYIFAVLLFLNGFKIFGLLLKIHEGAIRMMYVLILFLKIFAPTHFKKFFEDKL